MARQIGRASGAMRIWGNTAAGGAKGIAVLEDGIIEAHVGIGIEGLQREVEPEPGQDQESKAPGDS